MFNRRSLQVSVVKNSKTPTESTTSSPRFSDAEINLMKSFAKGAAKYLIASVLIFKFADTASTIAVNYAPKN